MSRRLIDAEELDKDVLRYASRKHAQGNIEEARDILKVRQVIGAAPAIDAEPVRHGRWTLETKRLASCSICGMLRDIETQTAWDYCPNCGAKMAAEVTDEQ